MNITELARRLKVTPQELRNMLPQLGYDIGHKAIKVDNYTANKIIQDWPKMMNRMKLQRLAEEKEKGDGAQAEISKTIEIPGKLTVREFSAMAGLPVNKVIAELMKNGIFVSLNENIDFDTAAIIGSDLGMDVKLKEEDEIAEAPSKNLLQEAIRKEGEENLTDRPPVIVVMGHVDHGKTKLLDAIRRTNVAEGEAGGITQHIGAYQVVRRKRAITFIDTPGHEAFTAMRSRGAKVADIAILVVAADDGVKPQTTEAYRIIESSKVPFIVAINKMDKPEANLDKTKQELSTQLNITPEDWGGKTICVPVSAKEGTGVEELLDMVLLTADLDSQNIRANPQSQAMGTIIESHIDKGEGPVATILIQNGTLKTGEQLVLDGKIIGKARALKNYRGEVVEEAEPSMPVKIIGLKIAPEVGDVIRAGEGRRIAIRKFDAKQSKHALIQEAAEDESPIKKINILLKSDVFGSAEAIEESLEKINTSDVRAVLISKGLGNITEGDIMRAEASGALVVGFNVHLPPQISEMARERGVEIKTYKIIYDLINDIKKRMEELLEPEIITKEIGKMKVAAIFRTEKKSQIIGGKVTEGRVESGSMVNVVRDGERIAQGRITALKSGKEDVTDVENGQECGIQYEGEPAIQAGDTLEFYKEEKVKKKI